MTETQVQNKIRKNLESLGWFVIRLTVTGKSGTPDLLALKKDKIPFFIEVKKTKGGVISPLQVYMLKLLNKLGFKAIVANSWEVVELNLKENV